MGGKNKGHASKRRRPVPYDFPGYSDAQQSFESVNNLKVFNLTNPEPFL